MQRHPTRDLLPPNQLRARKHLRRAVHSPGPSRQPLDRSRSPLSLPRRAFRCGAFSSPTPSRASSTSSPSTLPRPPTTSLSAVVLSSTRLFSWPSSSPSTPPQFRFGSLSTLEAPRSARDRFSLRRLRTADHRSDRRSDVSGAVRRRLAALRGDRVVLPRGGGEAGGVR